MDDEGGYGKASRARRHRAGMGITATPYARPGPAAPVSTAVAEDGTTRSPCGSRIGSVLKAPLRAAGYVLTKVRGCDDRVAGTGLG